MRTFIMICTLFFFLTLNAFAQECKVLRISSGTNDWLPVAYKNSKTQKDEGIAYDIVKNVAQKLSIPLEIHYLPWGRMLLHLDKGKLDMSIAIYWNKERDKKYLYSIPYFANEARVFVKKGNEFSFRRLEDLIGRKGAIPDEGSFGEEFDSFARQHQLELHKAHGITTKEQMVGMLLRDRIEYFIQDYLDSMMYLKSAGQLDSIALLEHPIGKTNVHFAFSRKSACSQLIPEINTILEKLKKDGTVKKIVEKYTKYMFGSFSVYYGK
jgi:polar amino acid transport system substrate-binding protein